MKVYFNWIWWTIFDSKQFLHHAKTTTFLIILFPFFKSFTDNTITKQMEILSERWHYEYRWQRLYFPEIKWRCRVVKQFKEFSAKTTSFHLSATHTQFTKIIDNISLSSKKNIDFDGAVQCQRQHAKQKKAKQLLTIRCSIESFGASCIQKWKYVTNTTRANFTPMNGWIENYTHVLCTAECSFLKQTQHSLLSVVQTKSEEKTKQKTIEF